MQCWPKSGQQKDDINIYRQGLVTRSDFCCLLWPDRAPAQARSSLRQSFAAIRKHLAAGSDDDGGAITLHSDRAVVKLTLLAWCHALRVTYLWNGRPDDENEGARRTVDKAPGLIEGDPTALTAAGAVIGLCSDKEDASALIERAHALDPNNAWAWARWGWIAIYRGEPELAAERFENAMKLSPLDPFGFNARMGRASALAQMGRFGEATEIAKGETRTNETHASTTDPDARLLRKSRDAGAVLCFMGHALMENRGGLVVGAELTRATGIAECLAALAMLEGVAREDGRRVTVGADNSCDTADFVMKVRELNAVPYVAQNTAGRRSAIDGGATRHPGHAASQRIRKRIEEVFGWTKSSAGNRKTKFRGLPRVRFAFTLAAAAYNLIRLPKLIAA